MDNFKLTTKEEVLDYFGNKQIALNHEKKIAHIKGAFSLSGFGGCCSLFSYFAADSFFRGITEYPFISSMCFFGASICINLSYRYIGRYALCRTQLRENDKQMKWIKNGTFQKNTVKCLEKEVIASQQSDFSKVKGNMKKF